MDYSVFMGCEFPKEPGYEKEVITEITKLPPHYIAAMPDAVQEEIRQKVIAADSAGQIIQLVLYVYQMGYKAQFATIEASVHKAFGELGAEIVPLSGNERIKVLYDYYHLGDENSFDFDIHDNKDFTEKVSWH